MHDVFDGVRNSVMLAMLATFALLALVFSSVVGTDWLEGSKSEALLTMVAVAIAPAYAGPVGLLADDQTKGSVFAVPIVVFAVMPLLGIISDELRTIACVLPTGFAAEVSCLMAGLPTRLPLATAVCLCVVWTTIGAALVFWAHRRYAGRIVAMVDRMR